MGRTQPRQPAVVGKALTLPSTVCAYQELFWAALVRGRGGGIYRQPAWGGSPLGLNLHDLVLQGCHHLLARQHRLHIWHGCEISKALCEKSLRDRRYMRDADLSMSSSQVAVTQPTGALG